MNPITNYFKSKWRRPKHKGVSGNFSTIVIITSIVIGSYMMSGGGYPDVYTDPSTPMYGQPLEVQPKHEKTVAVSFRELKFKQLPTGKPTPIPTFGPTPVLPPYVPPEDEPTVTPPSSTCSDTALVFLIDASTSMKEPGAGGESKLENLKRSLTDFTTSLDDETLFGLYSFSSPNASEPKERVAIAPFVDIEANVLSSISGINPPGNAATHMRQGFSFVQGKVNAAKIRYPNYKFSIVFISDGVPEQEGAPGGPGCQEQYTINGECDDSADGRNYDKRHDPTGKWGNTDIPGALKSSGVDIYSIVIYNARDSQVFPELKTLMQDISSGSSYYSESLGGSNLESIYSRIKASACS